MGGEGGRGMQECSWEGRGKEGGKRHWQRGLICSSPPSLHSSISSQICSIPSSRFPLPPIMSTAAVVALLLVHSLLLLLAQFLLLLPGPALAQNELTDNELLGDPVVECEETMISLTFKTRKPFNGRIYVHGMADDERCSRNFATNTDQSKFSMMIQNGDCTMQRQRVTGSLEGMMLSLTIVVSFHGTFVTRSDRAYRCMCFFRNVKHLTNAIDVNLLGTTELMDTAKTPSCLYSIHTQSPDGPPLQLGKVGDKIFHVWECDDPVYGFLVHSCSVDDGRGSRFDLLDVDGCAIDPIIQPDVVYVPERNRAHVETFGYKFSDTTVLNYQCSVELCKKANNECHGLTPPICGRQKRAAVGHGREEGGLGGARNRSSVEGERMDLLTSVKVLDAVYESGDQLEGGEQALAQGELVRELAELDPARETVQNCLRAMAIGFVVSVLAALLLIVGAVIVLVVMKRHDKEQPEE